MNISLLLFLQLAFFVFCATSHSSGLDQSGNLLLTEKDDQSEVHIVIGSILTLKLKGSPGTGYGWQVARNDSNLLKLTADPFFLPADADTGKERLGAAAYQVFRFHAEKSGTNVVKMSYTRPWEKKSKPLKTFTVTVRITGRRPTGQ